MLSVWIRLFEPENEIALNVAKQWAFIAEKAFSSHRVVARLSAGTGKTVNCTKRITNLLQKIAK